MAVVEDLKDVYAKAKLIRSHIPIVGVSLIVQDYLAEPVSGWPHNICVVCSNYNTRRVSSICKECVRVCLDCKEMKCSSDKKYFCNTCAAKNCTYIWDSFQKGLLYQMWHRAIFPSEIHYEYQDKRRRDMAKLEEEKRKQDEFFAAENEKSLSQQIIDLRNKLWDANKEINQYKETHFAPELKPRPKFPYF